MSAPGDADRIRPRTLKGFRDYLPAEMRARQEMIRKMTDVFERFGFGPLGTPALEYSGLLLGKYGADAEKLLYRFRDQGDRDVCLRYDLTVPLARFVAEHKDLAKPFKRYQIAPVWRAEKPGRGRFREFMQCDADVVGSASLMYDAECIALGYSLMKELGVEKFEIRVSTRKMLVALGQALGIEDDDRQAAVFRTIDKLSSQGEEKVKGLLVSECACTPEQIDTVIRFVTMEGTTDEKLAKIEKVLGDEPAVLQAVADLRQVLDESTLLGVPAGALVMDLSIARGLDYYTGTVYETYLTDLPGLGSVMSGGRYDGLITRFTGRPVPAVGISVGTDRLFAGLVELGLVEAAGTRVVAGVAAYDDAAGMEGLKLVSRLRQKGIPAEPLYDSIRQIMPLKRQMKRASQRGIPYVLILGPDEVAQGAVSLKDMSAREQVTVPVEEALERLVGLAKP